MALTFDPYNPTEADVQADEDYIRKDIDHYKGRCLPSCEFCSLPNQKGEHGTIIRPVKG